MNLASRSTAAARLLAPLDQGASSDPSLGGLDDRRWHVTDHAEGSVYRYSPAENELLRQRARQLRDQTQRWQRGELSDDEFKPLRLQNGLYLQRHAPMLRVAIPYGLLSSRQLRALAEVADRWDKGEGHFTTRQNIQYNWPAVEAVPDILEYLADHSIHAIQTSGNCIRNITSDPYAGIAADEEVDPRPFCELLRQWSTFHPEFHFLPRKFKIAVIGSAVDRAAIRVHDIGIRIKPAAAGQGLGEQRFVADIYVGGGLGRTPLVAPLIKRDLPWQQLPSYLEAVMRVYNRHGRRDNLYKARIKILVRALGADTFAAQVDQEWQGIRADLPQQPNTAGAVSDCELDWGDLALNVVRSHFPDVPQALRQKLAKAGGAALTDLADRVPAVWLKNNTMAHRQGGAVAVTISVKSDSRAPGDVSSAEMRRIADLADQFSYGTVRTTIRQNLVLPHVAIADLPALHDALIEMGLADPTVGLAPDLACCPGGDFCGLANARSIPVAKAIREQLQDVATAVDLGPLPIQVSGCMNSCGHHHLGAIGVLGVDKDGEEWFQVYAGGQMGGVEDGQTRLGTSLGPSLRADQIAGATTRIITVYRTLRTNAETFTQTFARVGAAPFKEAVRG